LRPPLADQEELARIQISTEPFCAETPHAALKHATTPAGTHYVRSNFAIPTLHDAHTIAVGGDVDRPYELRLSELRSLRRTAVTFTMECAGNDRISMQPLPPGEPWRSGAVSTAEWSGVALRDLLRRAEPLKVAIEVVVEGADHGSRTDASGDVRFARSLPIDAIGPEVIIADRMNGAAIPAEHGGPARLIVPGWYGMASVKWVARISARSTPFDGYFQRRRYVYDHDGDVLPVTRTRVKSVIVAPADGEAVGGGEVLVWGWAWSGDGAITSVELSSSAAAGWTAATLQRPESAYAWSRWECRVALDRPGRYVLRSRATDARGNTQPDVVRWNRLGYGNNAVRQVVVEVESR
jgi:DMSO/TMAO reductase YedYZ molybdopterin-dependent catalytic subunit